MSLTDAVRKAGVPPSLGNREEKKRFSEILSRALAEEVAEGLRRVGFGGTMPSRSGRQEKEFQGGLGPKKVDVSYSDERNGLMLAVSIKTISFPPFGKNLNNRFGDLCTEGITLHMRFPYSVVCALFAFPVLADRDTEKKRTISTFRRAAALLGTLSGRQQYTDPGEKFENITMLLYHPAVAEDDQPEIWLFDSQSMKEIDEADYYVQLRQAFVTRNPHLAIEEVEDLTDS